ncbi:unnamed protein product [Penicillium salamii]|uniref:Uncharacterized protein n=1 Tax=Penicillium salamii TaxID=1612424 RepID=A0A9W4JTS8_9EURO|nr:unnamed protein product [Penicillium salamii]CAG7988442.1 unnamed protein product [Penicillium salamii]CAG7999065.1 unnamed protein product [Penicillium salamii]CAG8148220.1 unnamed protein product [Penicillium salamii]CAG8149747.1 unnamed protein product [Penicillium salamii]
MSVARKLLVSAALTGSIGTAVIYYNIWDIHVIPLTATDPIFTSTDYKRSNPNNNPTIQDLHVIRVPLSQIDSGLANDPERLSARYCGAVWAGAAFAPQRLLHTWLGQPNPTKAQLWSSSELLQSDYQVGTDIAASFEVVSRTTDSVLIRGGDSTSNRGLRPLDAFIEVTARVDKENNVAVFGFKSLFFQGLGMTNKLPMPGPAVWLHELYAKMLLKSGVRYVLKQ